MKVKCKQVICLIIPLAILIISVSCSKIEKSSYNQVIGNDFAILFGKEETKAIHAIEQWKEIANVALFQEFSDEQMTKHRVYSMDEKTETMQYRVYVGFIEKGDAWIMNSCEKKGTGAITSKEDVEYLSKTYDILCGRYGKPEYTEFDGFAFSDLPEIKHPVKRTASWPGTTGHPTAVFSIETNEDEINLYIMEREVD